MVKFFFIIPNQGTSSQTLIVLKRIVINYENNSLLIKIPYRVFMIFFLNNRAFSLQNIPWRICAQRPREVVDWVWKRKKVPVHFVLIWWCACHLLHLTFRNDFIVKALIASAWYLTRILKDAKTTAEDQDLEIHLSPLKQTGGKSILGHHSRPHHSHCYKTLVFIS